MAGNLIITDNLAASPSVFTFTRSLFFLSLAVVGGVSSLPGSVAAGVLFAALTEAFYQFSFLNGWLDVVSTGLLLAVLLGYPGGLGAAGPAIVHRVRAAGAAIKSAAERFAMADVQESPAKAPAPVEEDTSADERQSRVSALAG